MSSSRAFNRGVTVHGRLLQDGRPVPGAEVRLSGVDQGSSSSLTVYTTNDGAFLFPNAPAKQRYWFYGVRDSLPPNGITPDSLVVAGKPGTTVDAGVLPVQPGRGVNVVFLPEKGRIPLHTQVIISRSDPESDRLIRDLPKDGKFQFPAAPGEVVTVSPDSLDSLLKGVFRSPPNVVHEFQDGACPDITISAGP